MKPSILMPPFLVLALFAAIALAASPAPAEDFRPEAFLDQMREAGQRERSQRLLSHGVNPTPTGIVRFLEEGFASVDSGLSMPPEPRAKTDVYNSAIAEAGFRRVRSAVPVLIRLVDGDPPRGLRDIIGMDLEPFPLDRAESARRDLEGVARLNAVIALGYIGDPAAADAVYRAMQREEGRAFITEGAVALALMGDTRGIALLPSLTRDFESGILPGVYESIFHITGRNYGVTRYTALPRRQQHHEDFQQWLARERDRFDPRRSDILRRRAIGLVIPDPPIGELRGALRASRDGRDYERRYTGRQRLRSLGPGIAPQLREIAEDEMEDVDIRRAAMAWYAASDPREARSVIRGIRRRTSDPMIREVAERLEDDIEEQLRSGRR